MKAPERWGRCELPVIVALILLVSPVVVGQKVDVVNSKHNLSASGPGPVTSQEQDTCLFCHTPHTSYVDVEPLWNHTLSGQTYNTYTSSTYGSGAQTPSAGVSKVCLSCHDGTVALGQTVSQGLIPTTGNMSPGAMLGTDMTNDHPFGMTPVDDGQLAVNLFQNPPASKDPAVKLPGGKVECTSCHDPHRQRIDPVAEDFLVRSNSAGAICLACHDPGRAQPNWLNGWTASSHSTATNTVPTTGNFGPYGNVSANACGNCHRDHGPVAGAAPGLLRAAEESACSPCHSGANVSPALLNVLGEFSKAYRHPTITVSGQHDPAERVATLNTARSAECTDCHNPHRASATGGSTTPPGAGSALLGVSGYNGGAPLRPATNEYEVCFKCHADSTNKLQNQAYNAYGRTAYRLTYPQAADPYNTRLRMASNVARHNVTNPRWRTSTEAPSVRTNMLNLNGTSGRAMGSYLYCTDCHSNDQNRKFSGTGPNGPHGSNYPHLLERRYEAEPPPASPGGFSSGVTYQGGLTGTYALCDKCHDITNNILQDKSFKDHNKHISGERTSCSTCHDAHGITGGTTTNNFSMVNFDRAIVGPSSSGILRFERTGTFAGRCYLTCHGANHNPFTY